MIAVYIIGAFFAGLIAPPIYEALSAWLALKRGRMQQSVPRAIVHPLFAKETPQQTEVIESFIRQPAADKRRRGVAELRHRAEQASMKPAEHQAQVTAKNIKAMEG